MFRASLTQFQGSIDLLLYLVRKNELDILDIPLTAVLEQYRDYIVIIKEINVNSAGDFLSLASQLVEIKAAEVLAEKVPPSELVAESPKQEIVRQLLEYKKYSDAAARLQVQGANWQLRFPRSANDLPVRDKDFTAKPIQEIELWDLVSAFGKILRNNSPKNAHTVVYDDTPLHIHMQRIHQQLQNRRKLAFRSLFLPRQHKSTLIGIFLASLELVRHEFACVYQEMNFGEIELAYRQSSKPLDFVSLSTNV